MYKKNTNKPNDFDVRNQLPSTTKHKTVWSLRLALTRERIVLADDKTVLAVLDAALAVVTAEFALFVITVAELLACPTAVVVAAKWVNI